MQTRNNELISIIVPVYNVEQYIEKCAESIINQSYKNLEIILVDDGSTDKSANLCDKIAEKDSRVKVLHKKNGGLSDARNAGIKIAKGEYIGFVDSDDYIELDMYEILYNLCKKYEADIAQVSFYMIRNEKIIEIGGGDNGQIEEMNKEEAIKELLIDKKVQNYVWNKLFRKKLFDNIEFPVNMCFEDAAIEIHLFEKINKFVLLKAPKYYYMRRNDSILGKKNIKLYMDKLHIALTNYNYLDGKFAELDLYNAYNCVKSIMDVFANFARCDFDDSGDEFASAYNLVYDLIKKYGESLIKLFDNYDKSVLYLMLLDRKNVKEAVKQLELARRDIKSNPNARLYL